MDRSLDEIIGEQPRGSRRPPPTGPRGSGPLPRHDDRREEYPRDGVRKIRHDDRVNVETDWVHDRYEDDKYDRLHRRPPPDSRYEAAERAPEPSGTRVRIDNMHYDITQDELRELFSQKGRLLSVKLQYDRADRSTGTAFVTYEDLRDARAAVDEYDGQNAKGQPIRVTIMPSGPAATNPKAGLSMFDRIERPPPRSMFERIESSARDDSRDRGTRRRERSDSPRRSNRAAPPDRIDRYVPGHGSRSPIRRRGTPREPGRRPGAAREDSGRGGRRGGRANGDGRPVGGPRPKKTAEELDAEMDDYWGSKGGEEGSNVAAAAGQAGQAEEDTDMVL